MPVRSAQLESMLSLWESDRALLDPNTFQRRAAVQTELERLFTDEASQSDSTRDLILRARSFQARLESINNDFFGAIRLEIQAGRCPREFTSLLSTASAPPRGLAYDHFDDLLTGVFHFDPPSEEPRALNPDFVFYQPTPARHIFHLISAAAITETDTLIDLGSGLGHVPLLVSSCTGATSIGIELDPSLIASAAKCAAALNLTSVSFHAQNAEQADLSAGTLYYLYTPFTGATLVTVLDHLHIQATHRPIRICAFGPCTLTIAQQPWLRTTAPPATDQITVFTPCT